MASIEAVSCEPPVGDEPCSEDHASGAPSTPASSQALPKVKAKGRGRPVRPRIDLDEQIAHANKLADVSKKMLVAAKSAQKAQKKQKHRLIRKAGKLSAEDLERMAVLKVWIVCRRSRGLVCSRERGEEDRRRSGRDTSRWSC